MEKTFWWFFLRIMISVAFVCLVVAFLYIRKLLRDNKVLRADLESWQIDGLTGLLSRRMFMELYRRMFSVTFAKLFRADGLRRQDDHGIKETAVERDARKGAELSVVFVDIDHFKKVNDTFGHKAGDLVLKAVGELLTRMVRQSDICGRYGGEELVAVLDTDILGTQVFIRRFRRELQKLVVKLDDGRTISVTVSIGAVQLEKKSDNMNSLIDDADKAMYLAKQSGRDAYALRKGSDVKIYKD